jgi:endonuclease/exonuclease/phosphatase family metal-dependent hydrolase
VQITDEADIEAPAFQGDPYAEPSTMTDGRDIRVTDRDVILRRVGSDVTVLRSGGGHYDTALQLTLGGVPFTIPRGYGWVNASIDGRRFRFVNTHLEAFSSDTALGQAQELYAEGGPLDTQGNVVFLGDINSDPLDDTVHDHSTVPHSASYDALVGAMPGGAGLFDAWLGLGNGDPGFTSGLSETVDDETADGFDHRIDVVLGRNGDGEQLGSVGGTVVGTQLGDRDPVTGLWPADHGGVVVKLRGLTR